MNPTRAERCTGVQNGHAQNGNDFENDVAPKRIGFAVGRQFLSSWVDMDWVDMDQQRCGGILLVVKVFYLHPVPDKVGTVLKEREMKKQEALYVA